MPTCPNCGSIIMKGDAYCSHCGTALKWENEEQDNLEMILKERVNEVFNDPNNLNLVYLMYANDEFDKGNYLHAAIAADESIKLDPHVDIAWAIKGESLVMLGEIEDATHCLSKSLDINPKNEYSAALLRDILTNGAKNIKKKNMREKNINNVESFEITEEPTIDPKRLRSLYVDKTKYNVCNNCDMGILKKYKSCPYCGSDDIKKY